MQTLFQSTDSVVADIPRLGFGDAVDVMRSETPIALRPNPRDAQSHWLVCREPEAAQVREQRSFPTAQGTCVFGAVGYVFQARKAGELMPTRDGNVIVEVVDNGDGRTIRMVLSDFRTDGWPADAVSEGISELCSRASVAGAATTNVEADRETAVNAVVVTTLESRGFTQTHPGRWTLAS